MGTVILVGAGPGDPGLLTLKGRPRNWASSWPTPYNMGDDTMGTVILVGAGPGDPGLLTLKGRQALEHADVVVYDRLVSQQILSLIPASAQRIDVSASM